MGKAKEDGGEAGLSDVQMHERPGAIVSMTAAGHDIGKRLSHTPGQAHAPKSGQKLLQPTVASYVEFAVVGTVAPLRATVSNSISGNPMFCCPRDVTPLKMTLIAEAQNRGKQSASSVTNLDRGAYDYVNPFGLGLIK